jgi:hypothetical protein
MIKLTLFEKYIINQIELGILNKFIGSLVSHPEKRRQYYIAVDHLKKLEIIIEFSGELTINLSSNLYKSQIIKIK